MGNQEIRRYEDAGRDSALKGDVKEAADCFAKARAVESEQRLPIEIDGWIAVHREFALFGALKTEVVAGFVRGLKKHADPDTALDALVRVAVLRTQAGQVPWSQLPKQVSAFAKAAGRDEVAVHRELLEQLLAAPVMEDVSAGAWEDWRPTVVRVCAESARVRGGLLNLRPRAAIDGWWLDLLRDCGATAALVGEGEAGAEPVDGRAAWLSRTILHPNSRHVWGPRGRSPWTAPVPVQLSDLIVEMAPALRADGVPVVLDTPDYHHRIIDVRVLQTCLAHGVPVADPGPDARLNLGDWLAARRPEEDLAAVVADPRFAPAVEDWAKKSDAARLWVVPSLRPFLTPPPEAGTAPHPLDGPRIYEAVHHFGRHHLTVTSTPKRPLYSLRVLTQAFREGRLGEADAEDLRLGETARLAGRIEWVVLRAVAPSTPADRREMLVTFLEVWAESVFTDPTLLVFHGMAKLEKRLAVGEHGLSMLADAHPRGYNPKLLPVTVLHDGTPGVTVPVEGRVKSGADVPSVGWGTKERLQRVLALLAERGPVPRDPEAAVVLAEGAGMSRHAAELALAGLLGARYFTEPFVDTEERKVLGISNAKLAEDGRLELVHLGTDGRLEVLTGVLPDDPAELWEPGGLRAVAERLAATWTARFGPAVAVPETTLLSAPEYDPTLSARLVCAAVAAPDRTPVLKRDLDTWLNRTYGLGLESTEEDGVKEFCKCLKALTATLWWAYRSLPVGDPVRAGIPETVRRLRERLAYPGLCLLAGYPRADMADSKLAQRFGSTPYTGGKENLPYSTFDDGLTIARNHYQRETRFYFRPAFYRADARTAALDAVVHQVDDTFAAVRFLLSPTSDRIVERVESGGLPVGAYEADPRASAPETVDQVAEHLGLDTDAATVYLQLLTLSHPTDAHLRTVNGWRPPRYKAALAALVGKGLAEEKRPKAPRGVFLPGASSGLAGDGSMLLLPELFAAARDRVLKGGPPA